MPTTPTPPAALPVALPVALSAPLHQAASSPAHRSAQPMAHAEGSCPSQPGCPNPPTRWPAVWIATPGALSVRVRGLLLAWAGLWLASVCVGPWVGVWRLNAHGHSQLYAHGHPFVDARSLWGIPNAGDVLSNAAFLAVALWGAWRLWRRTPVHAPRQAAALPCVWLSVVGLALTAVGSAAYHWQPSAPTLVLDRMGMAVCFAGVLGWAWVAHLACRPPGPCAQLARVAASASVPAPLPVWLGHHAGRAASALVLVLGLWSALLPLVTGNALPWAVLQLGGLAVLIAHAWRSPRVWWALVLGYALAKLCEQADAALFVATHQLLSGHSLKHLLAASAMLPLLASYTRDTAHGT